MYCTRLRCITTGALYCTVEWWEYSVADTPLTVPVTGCDLVPGTSPARHSPRYGCSLLCCTSKNSPVIAVYLISLLSTLLHRSPVLVS